MKKLSLFLSALALCTSTSYAAINCGTLPSCNSLGYKDTKGSCPRYTTCPFDENKVACDHNAIIGEIRLWAGTTIPDGWLPCDGKDYATTDYPDLQKALGSAFGVTNSGFKVPDLRGRVPVGVNADSASFTRYKMGNTGGEEKHVLTIHEMPQHTHQYSAPLTNGKHPGGDSGFSRPNGLETGTTQATGGNGAHENRMPYIAIQYIIYSGVYKKTY